MKCLKKDMGTNCIKHCAGPGKVAVRLTAGFANMEVALDFE